MGRKRRIARSRGRDSTPGKLLALILVIAALAIEAITFFSGLMAALDGARNGTKDLMVVSRAVFLLLAAALALFLYWQHDWARFFLGVCLSVQAAMTPLTALLVS